MSLVFRLDEATRKALDAHFRELLRETPPLSWPVVRREVALPMPTRRQAWRKRSQDEAIADYWGYEIRNVDYFAEQRRIDELRKRKAKR